MTRKHLGQYRLTRLQVVNWGTFDGYKDFPIDERGVILTGPSGSGKSSLMDAHSVVLLPTYDQSFNASADMTAKGAKRAARSMADYVRGAWSVNDDEHQQSKVQYLRGDSATWSAVAATYDNGAGNVTTAVAVKWFPGSGTDGASLKSWYQIHSGAFDLLDLQEWATAGFDTRGWRARHSGVESFDTQAAYQDALRRRVGIGTSSAALALLGKAKAMKNVGDLDAFIRTYMLDRPQTYARAERLVENFTQLDEAYRAAARAEAQEKVLRPMPEAYETYRSATVGTTRAADLLGAPVRSYLRGHKLRLLQEQMDRIEGERAGMDAQIARWEDRAEERKMRYNDLLHRLRQEQGEVGVLEAELQSRELQTQARQRAYERFAAAVEKLGERAPESAEEFAALREQVPGIRDRATEAAEALAGRVHSAYTDESDARRAVESVDDELSVLDRRASLLPPALLDQRDVIARATGVPAEDLPYAAELIDVEPDEQATWAGAAERVLRPLATTLLVPAEHQRAVADYVNANRVHGVLTYQVVDGADPTRPEPGSLATKLTVDTASAAGRWLAGAVARAARHTCVDSPTSWRSTSRPSPPRASSRTRAAGSARTTAAPSPTARSGCSAPTPAASARRCSAAVTSWPPSTPRPPRRRRPCATTSPSTRPSPTARPVCSGTRRGPSSTTGRRRPRPRSWPTGSPTPAPATPTSGSWSCRPTTPTASWPRRRPASAR
ncbi:Uncharacterized protein conserved in bacteria (plasmid) [Tsukamurella tyrosinosolvens]|uniref:ATP-binding protein n=1 Tax=Tsukamurella tyrosinosolvens TaxID=57704 RepID=UPI000F6BD9E9|nr:ATP-binding protein [Tsukamurella tyrosinosolvens]VEH88559.1 Uncharacterized protein conserved in bacteria [Tsukamurella tyrosinosolvens]